MSLGCTPWYFPFTDDNFRMCDPFQTEEILNSMQNDVPNNECSYCLPGVHYINIFHAIFLHKRVIGSFTYLSFLFWQLSTGEQAARKMLLKLPSRLYPNYLRPNCDNSTVQVSISSTFLRAAFTHVDPKSSK